MKNREEELEKGLRRSEGRNTDQKPRGGSSVESRERSRWNECSRTFPCCKSVYLEGLRLNVCLCTLDFSSWPATMLWTAYHVEICSFQLSTSLFIASSFVSYLPQEYTLPTNTPLPGRCLYWECVRKCQQVTLLRRNHSSAFHSSAVGKINL